MTPAAISCAAAGTPPERCHDRRRWLGKSLRPPGRGSRRTCSTSGTDAATAPTVAESRAPRATASASTAPTPLASSNEREAMSR